jgi:ring-1,2-phenylacetyl-CoA epoxidase subunit PaaD
VNVLDTASLQSIVARAHTLVAAVPDPEIPVISIEDLGILRGVKAVPHGQGFVIEVTVTPTYSGCPAMDQIRDDILAELDAHDIPARVRTQLAPAWTTDWLSAAGAAKLKAYGIAPPGGRAVQLSQPVALVRAAKTLQTSSTDALISVALNAMDTGTTVQNDSKNASLNIPCPRCDSVDTVSVSFFGSTACKSQYRCLNCKEPFDHFKPY